MLQQIWLERMVGRAAEICEYLEPLRFTSEDNLNYALSGNIRNTPR